MENDDGRKLSAPELKERRKQVIRAYKRGLNKKQISRDIGLSYPAVRNIIARYEEKGAESLAPCKKGRKEGENRALLYRFRLSGHRFRHQATLLRRAA